MSIRDFLLGVASSYVASILFKYVQPYVLPFLLPKLFQLIRLPVLRVRKASNSRAFAYAAAGYVDGTSPTILLIFTMIILYVIFTKLPLTFGSITTSVTLGALIEVLIIFLMLFLACIFTYIASIMITAMHLDKYFKWRLAILSPYISLEEEKQINAMWALMRNSFDYEQINQKLNYLAELNGIVLPEPFLNTLKI